MRARLIQIGIVTQRLIREHAKPGDTPDRALHRIFQAHGVDLSSVKQRKPNLSGITCDTIEPIILDFLRNFAGGVSSSKVIQHVRSQLNLSQLSKDDLKLTSNGHPRWAHQIHMARANLVENNYLYGPEMSGRGMWELTPRGRELAKQTAK